MANLLLIDDGIEGSVDCRWIEDYSGETYQKKPAVKDSRQSFISIAWIEQVTDIGHLLY